MQNKRLHPVRFFLHRYFYLGFAMLAIFVLVLPLQALVRLPASLNEWNRMALQSGGTLADYAAEIRLFLSCSLLYSLLGLEGLCVLFAVTGFLSAMMMAENALLRDFSLSCPASLFGAEPMESAKKAVKSCMTLSSFPCAQMLKTNTRYVHDFAKRTLTVTVNAQYMSTGKEVNDLRCVAADIAESIKRGLPESTNFFQVIAAYQSWLKRFFVYKKTGATRDHAAVGLLQTRQGVCQAIAALSMVILPHLGILARYVCGEGYSSRDWGPHAWNAVWTPNGAWHQVDFTFGLHRKTTPNTFTLQDDLSFRELHHWDEVAQSPALFQNVQTLENRLQAKTVLLFANNPFKAEIGGVPMLFDEPVLQNGCVRLLPLLTLLGGGCELLEDTLHIVLGRKTHRIPCGTPISNGFVPINEVLAQSGLCTAERRGGVVVVKLKS